MRPGSSAVTRSTAGIARIAGFSPSHHTRARKQEWAAVETLRSLRSLRGAVIPSPPVSRGGQPSQRRCGPPLPVVVARGVAARPIMSSPKRRLDWQATGRARRSSGPCGAGRLPLRIEIVESTSHAGAVPEMERALRTLARLIVSDVCPTGDCAANPGEPHGSSALTVPRGLSPDHDDEAA